MGKAVHGAGGGIGLDHQTGFEIVEDHAVAGRIEDVLILPFATFSLHVVLLAAGGAGANPSYCSCRCGGHDPAAAGASGLQTNCRRWRS